MQTRNCHREAGRPSGTAPRLREFSDHATGAEEVLEKGRFDPVLVDQQKEFIQVRTIEPFGLVAENGGQAV
ncbi:MAG: hypothetical protein ACLQU1_13950 [Bryobacteraceae bacterium]